MIDQDSQIPAGGTQRPVPGEHLGIFGGTFNPIHNGHLAIAHQTRRVLALDRILFIPTSDPPHKPQENLAPAKNRYEMVKLAINSEPSFAISDIEIRRPGKSYSVDTVRLLQQEYGAETDFSFLIGLDAFLDFPTWREPETLLQLCSFVVISRQGASFQSLSSMDLLPPLSPQSLSDLDSGRISALKIQLESKNMTCLVLPPSDVSASDIRMRIKQGLPVANLLPPLVESYILRYRLYK
ncbi:nicotinate-nucleotide adenylyltransferase [Petrachloros mirabilis]